MLINKGFKEASDKYERLRHIAREVTLETLSTVYQDHLKITLTGINAKALANATNWLNMDCLRPRAEWSWDEARKTYTKRHPNRFELAIWYDKSLCGLTYGRPSYGKSRLRIELIEGAPKIGNPLAQEE